MRDEVLISLVGLVGSLVLTMVAALNLMTSRQLLIRVSKQLEIAENQAEMNLIRTAFIEMSEFLQIFVDKPHLRPYFYDDRPVPTGDERLDAEIASMAEWILTNFATAVSLAAMLPEYPIGALKETIKFHLRKSAALRQHLEERFSSFPVTGLTLLRWTYDSKQETLSALDGLILKLQQDTAEARRLQSLRALLASSTEEADLVFANSGLAEARAGVLSSR